MPPAAAQPVKPPAPRPAPPAAGGASAAARRHAALQAFFRRTWARRGPVALALWPLSLLYGMVVALRHTLYRTGGLRSERLPVPVLVVGNVIAGGAGKTPTTIALVRHLRARGLAVGVVSRGHGRRSTAGASDVQAVRPDSRAEQVGDEPLLIARATGAPVFVARQRAAAARALLAAHPQTQLLLCDDGLQHLALARDAELCVFDERGAGNGWLLPAGPLRERWPRAVDWVLQTSAGPEAGTGAPQPVGNGVTYHARRALAPHAVRADGSTLPLHALRGTPLTALAAIARPEAFFAMLRAAGLSLADTVALPDHNDFDSYPWPLHQGQTLICTEKDAVKLWPRVPGALAVPLLLEPEPAFLAAVDARVDALLAGRLSSAAS